MYMDFLKDKVDSQNVDADAKGFETKATAMFARESWVVADIATNSPDLVGHYGSISLPVGDLGGGEYAHVPLASPNQPCAWDFIKFLTDQNQQLDLVTTAGWLPARADLDLTAFLKANPGYEGFLHKPAVFKTTLAPPIPEWDEIETKLATHLVDAYADYANVAGNATKIQSLLDTWAAETNAILKANGHQ
jgi:ABC-type glycerol-3-phosphate transport system substrate-binding protein